MRRLKKVFAGALAAAMLVCAVAVPAFAAEEVEQENCLSSSYVQMNISYADFYKAAGVDNASEIDAVTSATKNKTRAGNLAAGSYHVNADGTDITGVSFPVKVLPPWALKNAKQVTDADSYDFTVTLKGKESTTTYTGADALFENESYAYYKLNEAPAYYITAGQNPCLAGLHISEYKKVSCETKNLVGDFISYVFRATLIIPPVLFLIPKL